MEYHVVGGGLDERTCGEGGDGDLVGRDWEQREMDRNRTVVKRKLDVEEGQIWSAELDDVDERNASCVVEDSVQG